MASDKNKADLSPTRKNALKKGQVNTTMGERRSRQRRVTPDTELTAPGAKHQPQATKAPHTVGAFSKCVKTQLLRIGSQTNCGLRAGAADRQTLCSSGLELLLHTTWVKCASVVVLSEIAAKRKTAKTNLLESCADKRSPQCHAKLQCYTGKLTNTGTATRKCSTI